MLNCNSFYMIQNEIYLEELLEIFFFFSKQTNSQNQMSFFNIWCGPITKNLAVSNPLTTTSTWLLFCDHFFLLHNVDQYTVSFAGSNVMEHHPVEGEGGYHLIAARHLFDLPSHVFFWGYWIRSSRTTQILFVLMVVLKIICIHR